MASGKRAVDNPVGNVDNLRCCRQHSQVLAVFAKQPLPGQVKTRLCPPLSSAEAAAFYEQSLREVLRRVAELSECDLVICYAGERSWFSDNFPAFHLLGQHGCDLGERMEQGLADLFAAGYQRAVLIGSDLPDLPLKEIRLAFELLQDVDVVYGPARDGGYYLVGEATHCPDLFRNIPWSTEVVLEESLRKAATVGMFTARLPVYEDLDDVGAVENFLERSPLSSTARFLREHLKHHFENRERPVTL